MRLVVSSMTGQLVYLFLNIEYIYIEKIDECIWMEEVMHIMCKWTKKHNNESVYDVSARYIYIYLKQNEESTQMNSCFHYVLPSFSLKSFSLDRVTVILHLKKKAHVPALENEPTNWREKKYEFPIGTNFPSKLAKCQHLINHKTNKTNQREVGARINAFKLHRKICKLMTSIC